MGTLPHGIIVLGGSGAGTTTLGRKLASDLGFQHFDLDDYFWVATDPPYTTSRPLEERGPLLLRDSQGCPGFVFSGSMSEWAGPFPRMYDLAILLRTPTATRLERLAKRESADFGSRIEPGGDMHQNYLAFIDWARRYETAGLEIRSLTRDEAWLETLPCPAIRLDGTLDPAENSRVITQTYYGKPGEPWRVEITPTGTLGKYRYVVIFVRYDGQWLYVRQATRQTYETPGGHVETGETTLQAARRELWEETGASEFTIEPLFDYAVHTAVEFSYGQVFLATISSLNDLPPYEIAERRTWEGLPEAMTYPDVLPRLYDEVTTLART